MANEFKIKHGFISTGDGSIEGEVRITGAGYADNGSRIATRPWVSQFLSDNSYATSTDISDAIDALVASAPGTLDTLNELAAALGDDPNFSTTVTNSIATKLPLAGGTMTGNITFTDDAEGIVWSRNTDGASIKFYNTADSDTDSRLEFHTNDNNNEYFRWTHGPSGGALYEVMKLMPTGSGSSRLTVQGDIYAASNKVATETHVSANYLSKFHDITLTLTGDVSGSGTFNNMGNLSFDVQVADDSHNHDGRYYTETEIDTKLAQRVSTGGDTITGSLNITDGIPQGGEEPYTEYSKVIFDNSHNDIARGPNKIVMHDNGSGWAGGFGIHSSTVAYYTGDKHSWYKTNTNGTFTERMTLDASGNLSIDGTLSASGYNKSDWDTAFGWGDHDGLYASTSHTHSAADITSGTLDAARLSGTYTINVSGTSTYANNLYRDDNRTIAPSEDTNGTLSFGFTSFQNDNSGPWADYLHLRSYTDSSGGRDNLLMFSKSDMEIRLWQQDFNSAENYAEFRDVAFKDELQVPAIKSNGSTPSLNSGISAAEVRTLIGAGTSSTDTNFYLSGATFNTGDGVLSLTVSGATNQSVDLDGRYKVFSEELLPARPEQIAPPDSYPLGLYVTDSESSAPYSWAFDAGIVWGIHPANANNRHLQFISNYDGSELMMRMKNGTADEWRGWNHIATRNWVGSQNYLTSIPSEYLTQTEGDARYLQSLPAHNHNDLYYTETESDSRFHRTGTPLTLSARGADIGGSSDYVTSGSGDSSLEAILNNVVLNLNTDAAEPATIYFKSGVNAPSDFAYISFLPNKAGSSEEAVLQLGVENDGAGSSDYIRLQGRVSTVVDYVSSEATVIQDWVYQGTQKAYIDVSGNLQLDGGITANGYNKTNWDTAYTYSQVGHLPLAGGALSGQVIFPSAATTKPVLPNGFISRNDNADIDNGRHDIWGISERYYPSNSTAGDAWGIQWSGTPNDIVFVGGGEDKVTISLDEGNITTLGTVTANGGNSGQWNTAYGWGNHATQGYITSSDSISGNAATATRLANARNIALSGAVTGNANFDGSGNITISTSATSDPTLTLAGDASGSATFTNLGNATLTVTVANDSHTHDGRYYTESESDARFVNVTGDTVTGDLAISGATLSVTSTAEGSEAFFVDGVNGRLFTISDDLSDSLFSANTISGLPVIEAFADNTVKLGPYSNPVIIDSSGNLSIGGTSAATESYVDTAITNLIGGAPGALDTLNELAAAINDDASFASSVTSSLALKAPLASPALTGNPTAPTQATSNNSTRIATTAFVKAQGYVTTDTNYYLNGISRSGNTLTFSVSGATNQTYTFGSAAWSATSAFDAAGSAAAVETALNTRIEEEVLPAIPTVPTNVSAFTNDAGYITDGNTNWNNSYGFITASDSITGNAATATTATNLGSHYTADNWFRATGDDNTVKFYGNSRMMVFRTDGEGGDTGHTGYAFKWTYGGDGTGSTRMLLDNNGNLWTSSYGWLHSRFETAGAAATVEGTLNTRIDEDVLPLIQTPAITSNGSTPSLNSGITAAEIRSLIGAGTSSSNTNYYLSGASFDTSNGVLTLTVTGATDQTVDLDGRYDLSGSAATVNDRIDNDVIPNIPTNNNQLTNGAGYITDGNTNWNNTYGFITNSVTDFYVADQIIHTGDTNTYMQFHAADQWRVVTGGGERLEVNNSQVTVQNALHVHGNILLTGSATTTNQGRMIDFTGFDKEGTTDFSDRAYIQHTTNTGGHAGSVLVISSQNDSGDGIAFLTNASSKLKHNSNNIATENWVTSQSYLTTSGKAADSNLLDGLDSSAFLRSNTGDTASGHITFSAGISTLSINDTSNQQLVICAGEAGIDASQTGELVYVNAENGFQVAASNDNWATGYAGTKKTIIDYGGIRYDGNYVWHAGNFNPANYQPAGTYNTIIGTDSDINTSGSTIIDNIYVTDGVITSMGTRTLTAANLGIAKPAPPTFGAANVVGETIEVVFDQSPTSGVDYYQVWSSVAGGAFGMITQIPTQDIAATMTAIDADFAVAGTHEYRIYAIKNGIYSDPAEGGVTFNSPTLDVVNLSVVNLNTAYYIQYDMPDSRFVDHIEIYMDAETSSGSLSRTGASLIYSGNNTSYMYQIGASDLDKFHQFWVEVVES
jgi:hypothetical protein